jgi:cyclase
MTRTLRFVGRLAAAIAFLYLVARYGPVRVAGQAQQDFSNVQITTTRLGENLYALDGNGGRMAAQFGADGIFIVDTQFAPLTDRLVAAIRQFSLPPVWSP